MHRESSSAGTLCSTGMRTEAKCESFIKLTCPFLHVSIKFVFSNISIRVRNTFSHLSGMNTHTCPFHFMKNKAGVYLEKGNIVIFHPNIL